MCNIPRLPIGSDRNETSDCSQRDAGAVGVTAKET